MRYETEKGPSVRESNGMEFNGSGYLIHGPLHSYTWAEESEIRVRGRMRVMAERGPGDQEISLWPHPSQYYADPKLQERAKPYASPVVDEDEEAQALGS